MEGNGGIWLLDLVGARKSTFEIIMQAFYVVVRALVGTLFLVGIELPRNVPKECVPHFLHRKVVVPQGVTKTWWRGANAMQWCTYDHTQAGHKSPKHICEKGVAKAVQKGGMASS